MRVAHGTFKERIRLLAKAAGGQRALARIIGVSAPTIIGWMGGSEPYATTFEKIASATGVPMPWLRTGDGDDDLILEAFLSRLHSSAQHPEPRSSRVAEAAPDMECPITSPPTKGAEKYMLMAAETMSAEKLSKFIAEVLEDGSASRQDRLAISKNLTELLHKKLANEGAAQKKKN